MGLEGRSTGIIAISKGDAIGRMAERGVRDLGFIGNRHDALMIIVHIGMRRNATRDIIQAVG